MSGPRPPTGTQLSLEADLDFSVAVPGARTVTGRVTGSGSRLQVRVSDPFVMAGRRDAESVRAIADVLADRGVSVTVLAPEGPLVTLGAPRTSWLQRRLTRSRHIRIERYAGLWSLVRGRAQATNAGALPSPDVAPPATMWPLAPTLMRRPAPASTTHAARGDGRPRLIMALPEHAWPGEPQPVFALRSEVVSIGSDADCDIRLEGLDPRHAEVHHDERDEYVLHRLSRRGDTRVNGAPVDSAVLRTASRVQLGEWTMSFYREEYADHGRPYGGRIGGELGHQRPQAPRGGPAHGDWTGREPS